MPFGSLKRSFKLRDKLTRVKQTPSIVFIVGSILLLAIAIVLSIMQATRQNVATKQILSEFQQEQAQKQKELAAEAKKNTQVNGDVGSLEFKDITEGAYTKPSCKRLENRAAIIITNISCDYKLKAFGKVKAAVVYIYESGYDPIGEYKVRSNPDPANQNTLSAINPYLAAQGKRYGVNDPLQLELTSFGPYKVSGSVWGLDYRSESYTILTAFQKTASDNKVPTENYDIVEYFLLDQSYGGVAYPSLHQAFTYNSYFAAVPTFVHETLHLFGASDKYHNNDCASIGTNDPFGRYNGTLPGRDIMCDNFSLDSSKINDITAREIGWAN